MEIKVFNAALTQLLPICKMVSIVLLCISTTLLLSACEPSNDLSKPVADTEKEKSQHNQESSLSTLEIPASEKGKIEAIYGWLDSNTILFSEKKDGMDSPQLMEWNLKTNTSAVFYQPSSDFSEVSISPTGAHVLISSFTSAGKTAITILDRTGNPQYSLVLPAYELSFEWNSFQEDMLFLTSFYEDWTYSSYVINPEEQTVHSLDFPQPFAQWDSGNGLMFLDWDREEPALTAPLERKALNDGTVENLMLDVIHFKKVKHALMTIQVETEKQDRGTYAFYDETNKPIHSFSVPLLKSFSDWVIPAYDMIEKNKELLTFVPVESKDADQYESKFTLTKLNWETGTQEELMKDMENEPLSCSLDGSLCLYGNQFEKIIDIKTHQIKKLF
ncbi:hypothetical protein [Peribacillus sp. NPDC097225]|uniref:YqgU-like beta propeller domain-containing protein n=1 Tax=Peribacillus sp. NPDC097225 TaxID=3364400 RepID=UPI00380EE37F